MEPAAEGENGPEDRRLGAPKPQLPCPLSQPLPYPLYSTAATWGTVGAFYNLYLLTLQSYFFSMLQEMPMPHEKVVKKYKSILGCSASSELLPCSFAGLQDQACPLSGLQLA